MTHVFFTDRDLGTGFPDALRRASLAVEGHDDHFGPSTKDPEWLAEVGARGWLVLTRDHRIRYRPNELDAVMANRVGLFVLTGNATHPELAGNVINTRVRIQRFAERTRRPFIAKVYRPSGEELVRRPDTPGRVELWLSEASWRASRR